MLGGILLTSAILWASVLPGESVTGGKEAVAHSRPYMASVQLNGKHECGAFLIASQWLLSATHCFRDGAGGRTVVVGLHSLSEEEATKETFQISAVYNHPDFNIHNYDSDITLIKLDRPVVESDTVKPLSYKQTGVEPAEDTTVDTAGWGSLNNLGSRPDKLHELTIRVKSRNKCGRSDYYGSKFTKNMLCAAGMRQDTCDGDSGGPLLYNGVAVGITSNGGKKCGTCRKPGLYTIISHFAEWIQQTMTDNA
ncbi:complement factor D [Alosa sapidissima]|uniref:complement factor D n=1 Tax=Alosa sapidissima TaxID=34773 RepID=UPI001C07F6E4|nr:complement factor D [Alosa sapidissima]